jgi:hypothetical protein
LYMLLISFPHLECFSPLWVTIFGASSGYNYRIWQGGYVVPWPTGNTRIRQRYHLPLQVKFFRMVEYARSSKTEDLYGQKPIIIAT